MNSFSKTSGIGGHSRRSFIGNCAVLGGGLTLLSSLPSAVFAATPSDRLKVGLVGCGGRGRGAVYDCLAADPGVQIWAIGDVFPDAVENTRKEFAKVAGGEPRHDQVFTAERFAVTPDRSFVGFDAYKQVINSGVDLVILATPPHFRPMHLEEAVRAGVHVFAEKPVAVDPAGARKVIAVGELAKQKKLAIVAGTQRRHSPTYVQTLRKIEEGAIGELVGGQCYWMQGGLWHRGRQPDWSEMEYQMRNWLYFTWLSGDHIVEQHVHNIDVINWAFGGPPVKALGMGGRQSRTDSKYGDAWDHFSIEFEYANGARVQSLCRQAPGASHRVNERLVGTLGSASPGNITGKNAWKFEGRRTNSMIEEHVDLINSIRAGTPLNHARRIAESTLTAILGRVSAYTGKEIKYEWMMNASQLDLSPAQYALGDAPEVKIPVPGVTPLV